MKITLKDGAPRSTGTVEINVSKQGNTLEVGAAGVASAPIVLEFYDGKLNLRVYGDNPEAGEKYKTTLDVTKAPAPVTAQAPAAPADPNEFNEAEFDAA